MKITKAFGSRSVSFNSFLTAGIPLWNAILPEYALTAEVVTQLYGFGNILLRFITDGPVGGRDIGAVEVKKEKTK